MPMRSRSGDICPADMISLWTKYSEPRLYGNGELTLSRKLDFVNTVATNVKAISISCLSCEHDKNHTKRFLSDILVLLFYCSSEFLISAEDIHVIM